MNYTRTLCSERYTPDVVYHIISTNVPNNIVVFPYLHMDISKLYVAKGKMSRLFGGVMSYARTWERWWNVSGEGTGWNEVCPYMGALVEHLWGRKVTIYEIVEGRSHVRAYFIPPCSLSTMFARVYQCQL